jgi:hypothetical protein
LIPAVRLDPPERGENANDLAVVVSGEHGAVVGDGDRVGFDVIEIDGFDQGTRIGIPAPQRAVVAAGQQSPMRSLPGQANHVGTVPFKRMLEIAREIEDPDQMVARSGYHAPSVIYEDCHFDVISMLAENGLQAQRRNFPKPRGIVAACAQQVSSARTELALVGEMIMKGPRQGKAGVAVPQNDSVVVAGGGDQAIAVGSHTADRALMLQHGFTRWLG